MNYLYMTIGALSALLISLLIYDDIKVVDQMIEREKHLTCSFVSDTGVHYSYYLSLKKQNDFIHEELYESKQAICDLLIRMHKIVVPGE